MNRFKHLALAAALGAVATGTIHAAPPEGSENKAPDCPYGYYDVDPYSCAPYGYYGPEWFKKGQFIGAGPWFHGHVDSNLDVLQGYKDPLPNLGDKPDPAKPAGKNHDFKSTEVRDGRGHKV